MRASLKILLMTIVLTGAAPGGLSVAGSEEAIAMVLDDWHAAAAAADEDRYFAHFAPDAIFLGTDASERWTRDWIASSLKRLPPVPVRTEKKYPFIDTW